MGVPAVPEHARGGVRMGAARGVGVSGAGAGRGAVVPVAVRAWREAQIELRGPAAAARDAGSGTASAHGAVLRVRGQRGAALTGAVAPAGRAGDATCAQATDGRRERGCES